MQGLNPGKEEHELFVPVTLSVLGGAAESRVAFLQWHCHRKVVIMS